MDICISTQYINSQTMTGRSYLQIAHLLMFQIQSTEYVDGLPHGHKTFEILLSCTYKLYSIIVDLLLPFVKLQFSIVHRSHRDTVLQMNGEPFYSTSKDRIYRRSLWKIFRHWCCYCLFLGYYLLFFSFMFNNCQVRY